MIDTNEMRRKWAGYQSRMDEGDGGGSLLGALYIIGRSAVTDIGALCDWIDAQEHHD